MGLEILKGTHYPRTDCPGGHSVLGRDVPGGQYILGRNVRETAFPRTKCPAENLQGTKFPAAPRRNTIPGELLIKLMLVQKLGHSFCSVSSGTRNSADDVVIVPCNVLKLGK